MYVKIKYSCKKIKITTNEKTNPEKITIKHKEYHYPIQHFKIKAPLHFKTINSLRTSKTNSKKQQSKPIIKRIKEKKECLN